ncbi:MAG: hypothetical protein RI922_2281 [Bacteroidota bacterium]|jgi:hypothetical protein
MNLHLTKNFNFIVHKNLAKDWIPFSITIKIGIHDF